jgi:hypothetical protein
VGNVSLARKMYEARVGHGAMIDDEPSERKERRGVVLFVLEGEGLKTIWIEQSEMCRIQHDLHADEAIR